MSTSPPYKKFRIFGAGVLESWQQKDPASPPLPASALLPHPNMCLLQYSLAEELWVPLAILENIFEITSV